jgi:hypothetical protein
MSEGDAHAVQESVDAIYDASNLASAFEQYTRNIQSTVEAWIFDRIQNDDIAILTYREVFRMRNLH